MAAQYLELGKWYIQAPKNTWDTVLYFMPQAEQKNGGMAGILVTVDPTKRGAPGKAKKNSVPRSFFNLWSPAEDVPDNVKALVK